MKYWVHATTGGQFNTVANAMDTNGKVKWPNNLQSIAYNVAASEAIVKVDVVDGSAEEDWILANVPGHSKVIRMYTEADHSDIFSFFYTPAWQSEEV